jgi:hypothetical protein
MQTRHKILAAIIVALIAVLTYIKTQIPGAANQTPGVTSNANVTEKRP